MDYRKLTKIVDGRTRAIVPVVDKKSTGYGTIILGNKEWKYPLDADFDKDFKMISPKGDWEYASTLESIYNVPDMAALIKSQGKSENSGEFQPKASGKNKSFEGVSDKSLSSVSASARKMCEGAVDDFSDAEEAWGEFASSVIGGNNQTGYQPEIWLDNAFVTHWEIFVEEVGLIDAIIKSGGSEEAYDAYIEHIESL